MHCDVVSLLAASAMFVYRGPASPIRLSTVVLYRVGVGECSPKSNNQTRF